MYFILGTFNLTNDPPTIFAFIIKSDVNVYYTKVSGAIRGLKSKVLSFNLIAHAVSVQLNLGRNVFDSNNPIFRNTI